MIRGLEVAVKDYLTPKLSGAANLSGVSYRIGVVTGDENRELDKHEVLIRVQDLPREIPKLLDATVEIVVATPSDLGDVGVADHGKMEVAMVRAWDKDVHATAAADLSTEIAAQLPGWHGGDFYAEGWRPGREDTQFMPVFVVKVGVAKDGV